MKEGRERRALSLSGEVFIETAAEDA